MGSLTYENRVGGGSTKESGHPSERPNIRPSERPKVIAGMFEGFRERRKIKEWTPESYLYKATASRNKYYAVEGNNEA